MILGDVIDDSRECFPVSFGKEEELMSEAIVLSSEGTEGTEENHKEKEQQ